MGGFQMRQPGFLQLCCKLPFNRLGAPLRPPRLDTKWCEILEFQGSFAERSSTLDISAHRLGFGFDPLHAMLHQVSDGHDSANLTALDHGQMANPTLSHER